MNRVSFPTWDDDIEGRTKEIYRVADQIRNIEKRLEIDYVLADDLNTLYGNICEVLSNWTGHTYFGQKKNKHLQKAFQFFYESLYQFLLSCKGSKEPQLQVFAEKALYKGKLYRYLGHDDIENKHIRIEPEYNSIYVSWNKKIDVSNIKEKLYGTMTFLMCDIKEPYFGIDLDAFGVSRPGEEEVVFPTIEEFLIGIRYIEE